MSNEKILLDADVNTAKAAQSVGSIKRELREANAELIKIQQNFGPTSTEALNAAKKVAGLKDAIKDAKETADLFAPEKKFQAFAGALSSVAGGFSAVQGAMALMGSESKELEKQMLKVQGAMALSQGLSAIANAGEDFGRLGALIRTKVVTAFTTLRGAIIATGLGALVVIIGTIIANWDKLVSALSNAFPAFKTITNFFKQFRQIAAGAIASVTEGFKVVGEIIGKIFSGDFTGAIDAASNLGTRMAEAYNKGFEEKDKELKLEASIKQRKLELDLEEAKGKDILKKKLQLQQDELKLLEKGSEEYNAKLVEIEKTRTEIRKKAEDKRKDDAEKAHQARLKILQAELTNLQKTAPRFIGDFEVIQKKQKEILDENLKAKAISQKEYDLAVRALELDRTNYLTDQDKKRKESVVTSSNEERQYKIQTYQAELADQSLTIEERLTALKNLHAAGQSLEVDAVRFKQQLRMQDLDNQRQASNSVMQGMTDLATAMGANAETMKAIAIAQTTIDTYYAAQLAYRQATNNPITIAFPAFPFIMAGAAVAAGLARVAAISRVNAQGSGGGSPSPSAGGGGAPSAPRMPQNTQGISLMGTNQPVLTRNVRQEGNRVYVLESDITEKQKSVNGIKQKAKIK